MADLSEIGLAKNEAKAFEAVLKLGKAGASEISKESGVPYSRIYDVLASLEHKGLVKIIPEKGKKFIPGDPSSLKKLIDDKKQSLDVLDKEVEKLKAMYEKAEKEPVEIVRGKKNFYKIEGEAPKPRNFEYTIKYTSEYQPVWARQDRDLMRQGAKIKTLTRFNDETKENILKWLKVHKNIRQIPNEGVAISLRDDSIMIGLIKSNVTMLIRDKPFIALMKELFLKYYESAESIPK